MAHTVAELGEFGLIDAMVAGQPPTKGIEVGPGDDAAVLALGGGRTVATTDLLVESHHFRRDWSSAEDVGHKASAQNLADLVAMAARPVAVLVGLGLPADLPVDWVQELYRGLRAECDPLGVGVAGGDVVAAEQVTVAVTALGELLGDAPLRRGGARAGDVVAVYGRLGWAEAGLAVLRRGFRSPRVLVDAHRRPAVPYDAGDSALEHGATAMCDVSDGLLADAGHIATASGVAIDVHTDQLYVPDPMSEIASALGVDPVRWVLHGGEDHAMVATFPTPPAHPWRVVGTVAPGSGVTVDGEAYRHTSGHTHFG